MDREEKILNNLNKQQKKAVKFYKGPGLIIAGAGSGKTRVLTNRIAYLIEKYNVQPFNILGLTFTNKAADEMKERVKKMTGENAADIFLGTFHSFCVRILRPEINRLDFNRNFTIYDSYDQKKLVKNILKDLNYDVKKFKPAAVLNRISNSKNELIEAVSYKKDAVDYFEKIVAAVYEKYEKRLKENNALDFDDLIMKTVELFVDYPEVLEYYQNRFKFILIDEYQDVNFAQYKFAQLLSRKHRNIFVVGDPDQSIYAFRGADIRNILNFEDDYPEAKVIKLEENYRSHKKILDIADNVINNNKNRVPKKLKAARGQGGRVYYETLSTAQEEANFIARKMKYLMKDGYTFNEMAVLYRTNAQSRQIEDAMMKYGIPYQIIGGFKFYERKEIKDILAYLKLINNNADSLSFERIINSPKRGIGKGTLNKVKRYAEEENLSLLKTANKSDTNPYLSGSYQNRVTKFANMINELIEINNSEGLMKLFNTAIEKTGYIKKLKEENSSEAESRIENIYELRNVVEEHIREDADNNLSTFLEEVSLVADVDNLEENRDIVTLMTFHSAKGLEFPVVFMSGMEEGLFPHSNAFEEEDGIEEERRLCYVGITRAEDILYLSNAQRRNRYGSTEHNFPSKFLNEIPFGLIDNKEKEKKTERKGFEEEVEESINIKNYNNKSHRYKVGQEVVHSRWGRGEIVEISGENDLELTIDFGKGSPKTLLEKYAPIQRA
ncbi:MAG: DNA helicase PcrA [Halanaerobiales bacterium]